MGSRRTVLIAVAVAAAAVAGAGMGSPQPSGFPARLEAYLTGTVAITDEERAALLAGRAVTRELPGAPAAEVAVFGAVWIDAPAAAYVAAVEDIATFERGGGFLVTRKIGDPARVDDFAELTLPDEDVRDLRQCRVGDCQLKIGADGLARIREGIDWTAADAKARVEAAFRRLAVDYVTAYRRGGNARLAVYRDRSRPTFVATEFAALVRGMPALAEYLPDVQRYLLEFPAPPPRPMSSFLYWQAATFGLKPIVRINHVVIQEGPQATVVASKLLYASHYFWTALELRVLVPAPERGPGFWFVTVNRSRSDGLSGFVGRLIRGKVRDGARQGLDAALVATKARLEAR